MLRHGEIVEEGTQVELMSKRGLYYQLVKRQIEQHEADIKGQLVETKPTTIAVNSPSIAHRYSTSFNAKESI